MLRQSVGRQLSICSLLVFIFVTLSDLVEVLLVRRLASIHIESSLLATRLIRNCHGTNTLGLFGSHLADNSLSVRLVLEYATDTDGLALVTQREVSHLGHNRELLESDRVLGSYSANHFAIASNELRLVSNGLLTSIVSLNRTDNVLDDDLVVESMNMHYTGVTLGQDRTVLKKFEHVDLGFEDLRNGHHAVSVAENETTLDLVVVSNVEPAVVIVAAVIVDRRVLIARLG